MIVDLLDMTSISQQLQQFDKQFEEQNNVGDHQQHEVVIVEHDDVQSEQSLSMDSMGNNVNGK